MENINRVSGMIIKQENDKSRKDCRTWILRASTGNSKVSSRRFKGTYTEAEEALLHFTEEVSAQAAPEPIDQNLFNQECDMNSNHRLTSNLIQLEKDKTRKECQIWRLQVSSGKKRWNRRFAGTYEDAKQALQQFGNGISNGITSDLAVCSLFD